MTHQETIEAKFKEEADKILTTFKPMRDKNKTYSLNLNRHEERKKELADKIMGINAPDIDDDTKEKVAKWAQGELDKWMAKFV